MKVLRTSFERFAARLMGRLHGSRMREAVCDRPADIYASLAANDPKRVRFLIRPEQACMHGGFRYRGGWHPFVAALDGTRALADFYATFQPSNLAEMYSIPQADRCLTSLPPWALPWLSVSSRNAPSAEGGLELHHGVSYFGPASVEKIALEQQRLTTVRDSIARDGYEPDRFGDIEGWFLVEDDRWLFFVRGGKHRAAALASLGAERIPVVVRDSAQPILSPSNIRSWAAVRDGAMSADVASAIFQRYLDTNGAQLRTAG